MRLILKSVYPEKQIYHREDNIMKKKLLPFLLALIMITAMLPVSVLAALPEGVPSSLEAPTSRALNLSTTMTASLILKRRYIFLRASSIWTAKPPAEAPSSGTIR
jgi:hypothetical protein